MHVFTPRQLADMTAAAGFGQTRLQTADLASTLVMTASYVVHGRRPGLAALVPWRAAGSAALHFDALFSNRILPGRWRHTVVGVLRA